MKPSRSEFITVRGLRYHIRHWGSEGAPKLFMTHGWMDVSASFQFMVDCLQRDWHVIAPDWRGYGLTDRVGADTYWFPDYMGDLDVILDHYSPDEPVNLLGHSMGGNVVSVYAGVRPARIKKLINLEGPTRRPGALPNGWMNYARRPPCARTRRKRRWPPVCKKPIRA
jgi:pimeloyl-ACP methyl ester carboxylesterase